MERTPLSRKTPLNRKTPPVGKRPAGGEPGGPNGAPLARSGLNPNPRNTAKAPPPARQRNTGPPARTVVQVRLRDEESCVRCGGACHGRRGADWSVQHRRARGMGGTSRTDANSPANLILLCGSATTGCHGHVERCRAEAREHGWAIRQSDDPLQVPIVHWQRGLIFLRDDGTWSSHPTGDPS
jgi:hypothetical protein